jgi:hypothetical protein
MHIRLSVHRGQFRPTQEIKMLQNQEPKSFASNAMAFFGKKEPTQTLAEFQAELKALTQEDKDELRVGMEMLGYKFK